MSKTLKDFASNGEGPKMPTITPTGQAATGDMVNLLLHVCAAMSLHLTTPDDEMGDKNARDSACATFINATNRLDDIIKEDSRWNANQYDEVVDTLKKMYKEQGIYMKKAGVSADAAARRDEVAMAPHIKLNTGFYSLSNGSFLCCLGNISDKSTLKAVGDSPQEAANKFDDIFNGKVPYEPFAVSTGTQSQE